MTWNNRIAAARQAKGLTKSELARAVKVSHATIHDWENGDIKTIKGENLMNVCRVLGMSENYLLYGTEPRQDEPNEARSLGLEAETAGELRLLSIYRLANERERAAIDGMVEDIRALIAERASADKRKRG